MKVGNENSQPSPSLDSGCFKARPLGTKPVFSSYVGSGTQIEMVLLCDQWDDIGIDRSGAGASENIPGSLSRARTVLLYRVKNSVLRRLVRLGRPLSCAQTVLL